VPTYRLPSGPNAKLLVAPVGATIEDAVTSASVIEALVRSVDERRWVAL